MHTIQSLAQLFGRFHPLLVHLPIGILFLAFIFEFASYFSKFKKLRQAVQPALFFGAISAIAAAISGYILSQEGGYEDRLVNLHRNTGIATAIFATILYFLRKSAVTYFQDKGKRKAIRIFLFIPLIALLSLTGHLGGSLTHGEDYLFEFAADEQQSGPTFKMLSPEGIDSAIYYADIIEPILRSRCYSCHSSSKQKGQLRLDQVQYILKGGKHGAIINTAIADSSELLSRLMLSLEDEHHMPPNEKPQLSSAEIALIQAWIEDGASFENRVGSFKQAVKVRSYFGSVLAQTARRSITPLGEVVEADRNAVLALRSKGVLVIQVGAESNYLSVSFVNARSLSDKDLELLLPIKNQLLWLDLGRTGITDEGLRTLGQLTNLTELNLEYTKVKGTGLEFLGLLSKLESLNLVGTDVNDSGLIHLPKLKGLKNVFLFQSDVTSKGIRELKTVVPEMQLDTGGYQIPKLVTDTLIFKSKT